MVFLDHISNRLSTSLVKKDEDAMEEDEEDLFLASKIHLRLKMADSSCHKRNHKLALNILADIHKVRVPCIFKIMTFSGCPNLSGQTY